MSVIQVTNVDYLNLIEDIRSEADRLIAQSVSTLLMRYFVSNEYVMLSVLPDSKPFFRELAAKNYTKGTITRKALEAGELSDAHLHARARRYAVKMFLSHLHEVMYITILGQKPPMPFAIAHLNHAHYVKVPNPHHIREFVVPVEVEEVETTLI